MPKLLELYQTAASTPSDIWEHVPTLMRLARQCDHVTELGTRTGVSTTALLYGAPEMVVAYDLFRHPQIGVLEAAAREAGADFTFIQADDRAVEIEETDLLFIDTLHTHEQLTAELRLHGHRARRFVALHDTVTFGHRDETGEGPGLWPVIEDYFLGQHKRWKLLDHWTNNNGLTVFMRRGKWVPCQ